MPGSDLTGEYAPVGQIPILKELTPDFCLCGK